MRKNYQRLLLKTAPKHLCIAILIAAILCVFSGCRGKSSIQPSKPAAVKTASARPTPKPNPRSEATQPVPSGPLQVAQPDVMDQAPPDPLPVGTRAWNFHTRTIDGQRLTLTSLRGHVTVVDFWATWCGPCMMEIPDLEGVYKEYKGKGVHMVGISMDTDTAARVPRFVRAAHMTYTVAVDPYRNQVACDHYNAGLLPSLFIIDQKGVVRWCASGYHDGMMDDVKTELNQLLSEKA